MYTHANSDSRTRFAPPFVLTRAIDDPYSMMHSEPERLASFRNWTNPHLTSIALARSGFYCTGARDVVKCAFCKVTIGIWAFHGVDDPNVVHKNVSPYCSYMRSINLMSSSSSSSSSSSIVVSNPIHPGYASIDARLRSFKDWPVSMPQKPEELAEAGLFYTGCGDKTKCFYCDGGLKDWEPDDKPWEQHAFWFYNCAYVQLMKGRQYIQNLRVKLSLNSKGLTTSAVTAASTTDNQRARVSAESTIDQAVVRDSKLCIICCTDERNVALDPCGHVITCAKCALSSNKCPMCRSIVHRVLRVYCI